MNKVTYTPAEFAAIFDKERTWAYRQLHAGKVKAISEYGRTLIPKSEVDRLLGEAGRYVGANRKPAKSTRSSERDRQRTTKSPGAEQWTETIRQRKKLGSLPQDYAHSEDDRKLSSREHLHPCGQATSRQSVYQRLTRCKSSQKSGEGHGA